MDNKIISFDLGTGGNKASLYDVDGNCLASAFVPYTTQYPLVGWHEQRPADWWNAVVESTRKLLNPAGWKRMTLCVWEYQGTAWAQSQWTKWQPATRETPIWSDIRAQKEVDDFFKKIDPDEWYLTTGNGFPAACYTIFKVMWYRNHEPEMCRKIHKILGTKDYINYKLTGNS